MKKLFLILILSALAPLTAAKLNSFQGDTLVIGFWNVENLFDTLDDPQINDQEFLPESKLLWNSERYFDKLKKLAEVIKSVNNGKGPDLLGLGEIENRKVLEDLVNLELKDLNYSIIHKDSPDERGIDVGIIYKGSVLQGPITNSYEVQLESKSPTRLILSTEFSFLKNKITFFINHWPSRRGGQDDSERNRIRAASVLRKAVDNILANNSGANVIIMGDFNDEPVNVSLTNTLGAINGICGKLNPDSVNLFNISFPLKLAGQGSYKFREQWNMLDQIIISKNLFGNNGRKIHYLCESFEVYKPEIMVTQTGNYKGSPARTYAGEKYLGGYSDHFPVFAKFISR